MNLCSPWEISLAHTIRLSGGKKRNLRGRKEIENLDTNIFLTSSRKLYRAYFVTLIPSPPNNPTSPIQIFVEHLVGARDCSRYCKDFERKSWPRGFIVSSEKQWSRGDGLVEVAWLQLSTLSHLRAFKVFLRLSIELSLVFLWFSFFFFFKQLMRFLSSMITG